MKKILTLLLSLGIFTVSFAQGNHRYDRNDQYATSNGRYDNHNDRRYDDRNYGRNYSYANQREMEIQKINQDYNYQVMSIQNNYYMKNHQRKVALRNAMRERDRRLDAVNAKYNRMNQNWGRR
ncbi:MAG TPA: hypothetical protein VN722_05610 [Hanamia sp.]|nr:hypothetical protein [Hanamia sp.]